ncbi:MAG: flavodoxin-dependent (E)-4-hydroxy-3-methylbut-2-enyl-diphosphate synthase [Planctomycetota bacterium]
MIERRPTRQVVLGDDRVGRVRIGGGLHGTTPAPVVVQTMTAGYTHDVDACVAEIRKLTAAGAEVVRVAVPGRTDTDALKEIIPQVEVPIVADVHFHFGRALESVEAGVHKIRLNPGNIRDRAQVQEVIAACKEKNLPIRVGVNEGSIVERKDKQKRAKELGGVFSDNKHGHLLAIMIAKLEEYLEIFYEQDFYDICISAKSPDPTLVIAAYTEISRRFDHPLHLGVTHAGPRETGTIRSIAPLSHLLASGIGDTIRISYADDPVYEVDDALELMYCLELRERKGVDLIACPTCGRIQVDLFTLVQEVRKTLAEHIELPIKVAVMGCIVNGPGEAEGADVAIFAGNQRGIIYVQGAKVANVPEAEILERLLEECRSFEAKVKAGEAKLGEKVVEIAPPDPIGELGSGFDKIARGEVDKAPGSTGTTPLTVGGK